MSYANTDGGSTLFSTDDGWKGKTRGESSRGRSLRCGQVFIPIASGPPDPNSTRRLQRRSTAMAEEAVHSATISWGDKMIGGTQVSHAGEKGERGTQADARARLVGAVLRR